MSPLTTAVSAVESGVGAGVDVDVDVDVDVEVERPLSKSVDHSNMTSRERENSRWSASSCVKGMQPS